MFKSTATPAPFQRFVTAKARQPAGPASPAMQFGAQFAQAKGVPVLRRAVTPPSTKFGPGVGQPKAASLVRRAVAPPPTKFGPGVGQPKAAPPAWHRAVLASASRWGSGRGVVQRMEGGREMVVEGGEEEWEQELSEQDMQIIAYHEAHGWTQPDEIENPYLQKPSYIRLYDIKKFPFDFKLELNQDIEVPKYSASEIRIYRIRASRDRQVTGYREKVSEQGKHLFSFEALISSMESYSGPVINLLGLIGTRFLEYQDLPFQNKATQLLLSGAVQQIAAMTKAQLSIDAWQSTLTSLLETYVQAQQYSAHATSGYGSKGKSEGHHKEMLREVEHKMREEKLDSNEGAREAKEHIEALFDLHRNVPLEYRQQSVREGLAWLKYFAPHAVSAYQSASFDLLNIEK